MPDVITATEYLTIGTVPLATPAWRILDLTGLFSSADLVGDDRRFPGTSGVRAERRWATSTRIALPMVIWGDRNRENTPYGSVRIGLQTNLEALHAAIVDPTTGDGTRTAVWTQASGTSTAPVHVLGLIVRALSPRSVNATLQLSIPQGRFT
jgi:hypothetical protein